MDDRRIARWRLHTQRLSGDGWGDPAAVVRGLLGVQAENRAQTTWAVACRAAQPSSAVLEQQCDAGEILRTHVLRPTWHFVHRDDLRWLVALTGPRVRRTWHQRVSELGLDGPSLTAGADAIVECLAGGTHLTRVQLARRLASRGLVSRGAALGHLLADLEIRAVICSGVQADGEHTYALVDERIGDTSELDRDEAVVELVRRYVTGHGPATERDLAYWATMTLTDVRAGVAELAGELASFEHDGRTYWHVGEPPPDEPPRPRAHVLLALDELHHGYQDSRRVIDADGIVPHGRAATVGMVVVDAQMVGGMRRTVATDAVRFELDLHRELAPDELAAVERAAVRHAAFLDRRAEVRP